MLISEFKLYFSYGQFMVYDESVSLPGCDWTPTHTDQGFARRESTVCFRTLLEFGNALVRVYRGPYIKSEDDERVITVPFNSPTGKVLIEGPEDDPGSHSVLLEPSPYQLFASQQAMGEDQELISLYFHKLAEPISTSEILVADEDLNPPEQLIEDAQVV